MAVHLLHPDHKHVARVDHFSKVDIKDSKYSSYSVWVACVHVYSEVPHKSGQDQPIQIFITSDLCLL